MHQSIKYHHLMVIHRYPIALCTFSSLIVERMLPLKLPIDIEMNKFQIKDKDITSLTIATRDCTYFLLYRFLCSHSCLSIHIFFHFVPSFLFGSLLSCLMRFEKKNKFSLNTTTIYIHNPKIDNKRHFRTKITTTAKEPIFVRVYLLIKKIILFYVILQ